MELGTISDSSGGIAHLLTHKTDFIPSLVSELENEYWIKMTFPFTADGKLHSLTLKANRPDLRIAAPAAVPLQ